MKYFKFILITLQITLISCGQPGPLYLPSKTTLETVPGIKSTTAVINSAQ